MQQSRKHNSHFSRVRVIALLFSFPALISGCLSSMDDSSNPTSLEGQKDIITVKTEYTGRYSITQGPIGSNSVGTNTSLSEAIDIADIFVFEDNPLGRLDSYRKTKISPSGDYSIPVHSSSGKKRIVMIANYKGNGSFGPPDIHNYESLMKAIARLQDEDIGHPIMCGETTYTTGDRLKHQLTLRPFISEILLKTIRCDFKGTEYEGERMKNIKVYLTNVNSECKILQNNGFLPSGIVNTGRLSDEDLKEFRHPELVYRTIDKFIGPKAYEANIRLYCYPNESHQETLGTPFTRLVIEGEINGKTWYYPININRQDGQNGIGRNCCYTYNITILRTGTDSPDKPVCESSIRIDCRPIPWEERNDEELTF